MVADQQWGHLHGAENMILSLEKMSSIKLTLLFRSRRGRQKL
jgi:hypothetical protein